MLDVQQAKALFRGPMVSVATPFRDDYSLDLDALRANIRFMIERGMRTGRGVLLVAAAGGEFPMLSMEERQEVIRVSVQAAAGEVPIAASIQFVGTREVIALARYAHAAGAALGQLSAPYYYPPSSEDIYRLFRDVNEQSDLPIMLYQNWWDTPNMNLEMVARLAELRNVVALKWSASSFAQFTEGLSRYAGRFAIIDNAVQFVWPHLLGAAGFITHISNFWPEYPLELWELLEQRAYPQVASRLADFQWRWQGWAERVAQETEGEGPFIKAAMQAVGLRVGPPRPPARPVSPALCAELRQILNEAGVPRWGS